MILGKHDGEVFAADPHRQERIGQIVEISDAEVGGTAAYVFDDRSVNAIPDVKFDARMVEAIGGDEPGQLSVCTNRVLRSNSLIPRTSSTCLMVRVTAGCEVLSSEAAAMKLPYSASASTVCSWREVRSGIAVGFIIYAFYGIINGIRNFLI